jgi:hypothetical protein
MKSAAGKLLALKQLSGKGILAIADAFTRSDGALGQGWTGSTWTISSNKAINTPVPGSEAIANGGFASDTVWTKGADWTIAGGVGERAEGAGASNISQDVLTAGIWYRSSFDVATISASSFVPLFHGQFPGAAGAAQGTYTAGNRATGVTAGIRAAAGAMSGTIDNVSYKPLTLSELFATKNTLLVNVNVSVQLTLSDPATHACGVVANLDDATNPANFVVGYAFRNGVNIDIYLVKCVAGVYTQLVNQAVSYSAGAALRITKSGTTYKVIYNDEQVGIDQTVSDAGIISNKRHGMFSTHEGNSLDNFSLVPN